MTKPKKAATPRKEHLLTVPKGATPEDARRELQTLISSSEFRAVTVVQLTANIPERFDVPGMVDELRAQIKAVQSGDMSRVEAMLISQAIVLEDIFTNTARQAMTQTQLPAMEGLMRMALRAQNQCRATLETLATIKNPPAVFVKQANIAHGHQQINNAPTHAGKIENKPNELLQGELEHAHLDTRSQSQASGANSAMETVGAQHRGKNTRGQGD